MRKPLGRVSDVSRLAGSFAMVDIVLDREGRLVTKSGMNMR